VTGPELDRAPDVLRKASDISLASGEAFMSSHSARARLAALTNAAAVDMNSFGLILACLDHSLPLTIWRVISDRADESAAEDFRAFVSSYDGAGGAMLAEFITRLPPSPNSPSSYSEIRSLIEKTEPTAPFTSH
jgi:hypothetical protein